MKVISAAEAKQRLAALLDGAQREPILIRRQNRDVAVILPAEEYDRIRGAKAAELDQLCEHVSERVAARGLTDEVLANLLKG